MPFWGWSYDATLWANFTPPSSYRTNTEGQVLRPAPTAHMRLALLRFQVLDDPADEAAATTLLRAAANAAAAAVL